MFNARYAHTNLIAHDWHALADFYQRVFGCIPVPPERDLSGPIMEAGTGVPDSFPHGRDLYISLRGTRGSISWSPAFGCSREDFLVCADSGEFAAEGGRRIRLDLPEIEGYAGVAGLEFLLDLARALRDGSAPPVTGEDGLRALEAVEAVYRSAESGRAARVERAECC